MCEAVLPWTVFLPQARKVVERCGWQVTEGGGAIQRRDDEHNVRTFRFGYDNLSILKMWLVERFLSCWVSAAALGLRIPTIVVTPRWPEA